MKNRSHRHGEGREKNHNSGDCAFLSAMIPTILIFGMAVTTFVGAIVTWSYKIDSARFDSLRNYLLLGLSFIFLFEV